ncbi:MAG: hypothetical protein EAZ95_17635 [Bacteroidetes bacterium]|nr:MAG: hypothetical protein EAZ95_17635 [Bacteroidota bacterium]
MKTINKSENRATAFQNALTQHLASHAQHPDYEAGSFRNRFYKDVFMALLYCQGGLCAYTEELICDVETLRGIDWQNGVYVGEVIPQGRDADIEHFDSTLKPAQGWDWDNLFAVGVAVNRKNKLAKGVHNFFKPDLPTYNPHDYLAYDFATHFFVVKPALKQNNPQQAEQVQAMINVLGLNYGTTKDRRKRYLLDKQADIQKGLKTYDSVRAEIYQFFTAFEMSKDDLK